MSYRVVSCCVVLCRVVSCRVMSCRVVSCRVVSYRVVLCRVVSCRVVSCYVLCCAVLCCGVMCRVVSCRVVSCCVVSSRVVSCRVVSCRVVSCRVVSCRVVSCRVVSCRHVSCRVVSCRVVSSRVVSCRVLLCCDGAALRAVLYRTVFRPPHGSARQLSRGPHCPPAALQMLDVEGQVCKREPKALDLLASTPAIMHWMQVHSPLDLSPLLRAYLPQYIEDHQVLPHLEAMLAHLVRAAPKAHLHQFAGQYFMDPTAYHPDPPERLPTCRLAPAAPGAAPPTPPAGAAAFRLAVGAARYALSVEGAAPEVAYAATHDLPGLCARVLRRLHEEMPEDVPRFLADHLFAGPLTVLREHFRPVTKRTQLKSVSQTLQHQPPKQKPGGGPAKPARTWNRELSQSYSTKDPWAEVPCLHSPLSTLQARRIWPTVQAAVTLPDHLEALHKVRGFLSRGVPVDAAPLGYTMLHVACAQGNGFVAELLLYHGADLNRGMPPGGVRPVEVAAYMGHAEVYPPKLSSGGGGI